MEKVKENFRLAMKFINKFNLYPIPEVYTVWYNYVSGCIESLREEIDIAISSEKEISSEYILELYNKYFVSFNGKNVDKIIFDVNNLIEDLMKHISDNSEFFEKGSENLFFMGERLKNVNNKEGIAEILTTLLKDIKRIRERGNTFTSTLKKSEQEFNNLHNELTKLKKEARIDVLTGIFNRRGFDEEIKQLFKNEEVISISVIFADIDNFKQFNDNYGHLIGDEVLKHTAKIFKENLKGKDILARFGGEEFVVVIVNTDFKHVITLAEKLRKTVAEKRLIIKKNKQKLPQITVSMGVAELKKGEFLDTLIERADNLMYISKKKGKNRITF
jgi:diguanylate cyclase